MKPRWHRIPPPNGDWAKVAESYGIPNEIQFIDSVYARVLLPPGWTVWNDPDYPRNRSILDESFREVGRIYADDRVGFTLMNYSLIHEPIAAERVFTADEKKEPCTKKQNGLENNSDPGPVVLWRIFHRGNPDTQSDGDHS